MHVGQARICLRATSMASESAGSPASPHFTDRETKAQIEGDTFWRSCSHLEVKGYSILPLDEAQSYGSLKRWGVGMRVRSCPQSIPVLPARPRTSPSAKKPSLSPLAPLLTSPSYILAALSVSPVWRVTPEVWVYVHICVCPCVCIPVYRCTESVYLHCLRHMCALPDVYTACVHAYVCL